MSQESTKIPITEPPAEGAPDRRPPLQRELARILALDDLRLREEVARMAANWLVEHGTDLDGEDGISGADLLAKTYRICLARQEEVGERSYLALLRRILDEGRFRTDRTGTGTYSIFGATMRFDLREGFPLVTTKKVPFSSVVKELLWFLRGDTNIATLGCGIWDEWADERGDVGPVYGYQWRRWGTDHARWADHDRRRRARSARTDAEQERLELAYEEKIGLPREHGMVLLDQEAPHFPATLDDWQGGPPGGIDQLSEAIRLIKESPDSRRIVVSAWNVADLPKMRLPACHLLFQFYVEDGCLDLQMYQRSADMALGVPFNIASYALLLSMVARECLLDPRYFVHVLGDAHIYADHVVGIRQQLTREILPAPRLVLAHKPVLAQTLEDVRLEDYQHHPAIRFRVSV